MHRDRFYLSDRIRAYIENAHIKEGERLPLMRNWQNSWACRKELRGLRWNV